MTNVSGNIENAYFSCTIQNSFCEKQSFDVNQLDESFRSELKQKAEAIVALQEQPPVPLQITSDFDTTNESFGQGFCPPAAETHRQMLLDAGDLFPGAQRAAQARANEKFSTDAPKNLYVQKIGNVVGVIGDAGIGKTTLEKIILQQESNASESAEETFYPFYVALKDLDYKAKCSVLQFLTKSMLSTWKHCPQSDEVLLEMISQATNVRILIDGLDESRIKTLDELSPTMTLYDHETPEVILKNLLSGHILPGAKKLITSRPGAYHDLHLEYKPHFVVKVLGFSSASQDKLCSELCRNNDEDYRKVQRQLSGNYSLSALCHIPMYCRMIVLHILQNVDDNFGLLSVTNILATTLTSCVRSCHFRDDVGSIAKLAYLAYCGICDNKTMFDNSDLGNDNLETFVNVKVCDSLHARCKILKGDKTFYFSHMIWQEFFAAMHVIFAAPLEEFQVLLQNFKDQRWHVVAKFMFGLCNPAVRQKMQPIVLQQDAATFHSKMQLLRNFVETLTADEELSQEDLMQLCSWAHESDDTKMSQLVSSALPMKIQISGSILPDQISSLCHVLRVDQSRREIQIGDSCPCIFVGHGLEVLLRTTNDTHHKITGLSIENTEVEEDLLRLIAQQLDTMDVLQLRTCKLERNHMQQLTTTLERRVSPVKVLDVSDNVIDLTGVRSLSNALCNIKELYLFGCQLAGTDVEELLRALSTPLESLGLSRNDIGDKGAAALAKCLHRIKILHVHQCKMSEVGVNKIKSVFKRDQSLICIIIGLEYQ